MACNANLIPNLILNPYRLSLKRLICCAIVVAFTLTTVLPPSFAGELSNVSPELSKLANSHTKISPSSRFEARQSRAGAISVMGKAAVWLFTFAAFTLVPSVAYAAGVGDIANYAKEHWIITSVVGVIASLLTWGFIEAGRQNKVTLKSLAEIINAIKDSKDKEELLTHLKRLEELAAQTDKGQNMVLTSKGKGLTPENLAPIEYAIKYGVPAPSKEKIFFMISCIEFDAGTLKAKSIIDALLKDVMATPKMQAYIKAQAQEKTEKARLAEEKAQFEAKQAQLQADTLRHYELISVDGIPFRKRLLDNAKDTLLMRQQPQLGRIPETPDEFAVIDQQIRKSAAQSGNPIAQLSAYIVTDPVLGPLFYIAMGGGLLWFGAYKLVYLGDTNYVAWIPRAHEGTFYYYLVRYGFGIFGALIGTAMMIIPAIILPIIESREKKKRREKERKRREYEAQKMQQLQAKAQHLAALIQEYNSLSDSPSRFDQNGVENPDVIKRRADIITELFEALYEKRLPDNITASLLSLIKDNLNNENPLVQLPMELLLAYTLAVSGMSEKSNLPQGFIDDNLIQHAAYEFLKGKDQKMRCRSAVLLLSMMLFEEDKVVKKVSSLINKPELTSPALEKALIKKTAELIRDNSEPLEVRNASALILGLIAEQAERQRITDVEKAVGEVGKYANDIDKLLEEAARMQRERKKTIATYHTFGKETVSALKALEEANSAKAHSNANVYFAIHQIALLYLQQPAPVSSAPGTRAPVFEAKPLVVPATAPLPIPATTPLGQKPIRSTRESS